MRPHCERNVPLARRSEVHGRPDSAPCPGGKRERAHPSPLVESSRARRLSAQSRVGGLDRRSRDNGSACFHVRRLYLIPDRRYWLCRKYLFELVMLALVEQQLLDRHGQGNWAVYSVGVGRGVRSMDAWFLCKLEQNALYSLAFPSHCRSQSTRMRGQSSLPFPSFTPTRPLARPRRRMGRARDPSAGVQSLPWRSSAGTRGWRSGVAPSAWRGPWSTVRHWGCRSGSATITKATRHPCSEVRSPAPLAAWARRVGGVMLKTAHLRRPALEPVPNPVCALIRPV